MNFLYVYWVSSSFFINGIGHETAAYPLKGRTVINRDEVMNMNRLWNICCIPISFRRQDIENYSICISLSLRVSIESTL